MPMPTEYWTASNDLDAFLLDVRDTSMLLTTRRQQAMTERGCA